MLQEDQERAVQQYLDWCRDPESLVDQERVDQLTEELEAAEDPIEKLRLFTQLSNAKDAPEDTYLQPFLAHAVAWADENEIPVSTFEWIGVPRKHLITAGFDVKGRGGPPRRKAGKRVSVSTVIKEVQKQQKEDDWSYFTKPMLIQLTGASPVTIANAVSEMIERGIAVETDKTDPNSKGRGAKAVVFDLV